MAIYQETLWGESQKIPEEYKGDPRPDMFQDHQYWERLLLNTWDMNQILHHILHGCRCGGAELALTKCSLKLTPGEWSDEQWNVIKLRDLAPYRDKLVEVLRISRVMSICNEKPPEGW
ncbi:hypothetical protein [Dehalobacter restrictus]|uniref:hypothetical protein n=1 Tax=Dehalobacter restrictus TaxID=55583 RepID=UPI00338FA1B2